MKAKETLIDDLMKLEVERTEELSESMRELLANSTFRRALGAVLQEANERESLRGLDLYSGEGLAQAQRKQSLAEGMKRAVDVILDLAQEET